MKSLTVDCDNDSPVGWLMIKLSSVINQLNWLCFGLSHWDLCWPQKLFIKQINGKLWGCHYFKYSDQNMYTKRSILWPPDAKNRLIWKDPVKDCWWEEKGTTEDEMVAWHHRLNGHEFEQAPGVGDGQGSLVCWRPWGHRVRYDWATNTHTHTQAHTGEMKTV